MAQEIPINTAVPASDLKNTTTIVPKKFLRQLGIVGSDRIDAVLLAALAIEAPLLLIGAHGTAKSLLLSRVAEALDLKFRHYNASLLNYDDLVGYPLPDADGTLKFVETPASIWPAEAVFLDEISRCRPDMQNRLFPIIHEKCIQGMPITNLRFRWAAMNPPISDSSSGDETDYLGSEALDAALADRFPFVVEMPNWENFSQADRIALIQNPVVPLTPEVKQSVQAIVKLTQQRITHVKDAFGEMMSEYVHLISKVLPEVKIRFSGRRGVMLHSAIIAVHAARWTLGAKFSIEESAWIALKNIISDRARGVTIDEGKLQLAHRKICESLHFDRADPRRLLCQETDPVNRIFMALEIDSLPGYELSAYTADALASCGIGARHLLAASIANHGAIARVNPAIAEQLAILVGELEVGCEINGTYPAHGSSYDAYKEIVQIVGSKNADEPSTIGLNNLLLKLWKQSQCADATAAKRIADSYMSMHGRLQNGRAA
ncbi:MAG: MoxR family ATPase [Planctomycetota bacterium]|nr:MoxR family ATPase [Planctomycetota bacterium]